MPTIVVGPVAVPDVRGLDATSAEAVLAAVFLTATYLDPQTSKSVDLGDVLFQSPDPGTDVDPETEGVVTLTLSSGTGEVAAGASLHRKRRRMFMELDDGDVIEVNSRQDAEAMFDQLKEDGEEFDEDFWDLDDEDEENISWY